MEGMAPDDETEVNCLVCGSTLLEGRLVRCPSCDTAHHEECWEYNGGCATYACKGGRTRKAKGRPVEPRRPGEPRRWPASVTVGWAAFGALLLLAGLMHQSDSTPARQAATVRAASPAEIAGPRTLHFDSVRQARPPVQNLKPEWVLEQQGEPRLDWTGCPLDDSEPFVLMSEVNGDHALLQGIESSSGRVLWRHPVPAPDGPRRDEPALAVAAVVRDRIGLLSLAGGVQVLDRLTGELVRATLEPNPMTRLAVLGVDHRQVSLGGPELVAEFGPDPDRAPVARRTGEISVLECLLKGGEIVPGAGRGQAITQNHETRLVSLVDLRSSRAVWESRISERVHTGLVRLNYILAAGRYLWVWDRATGRLLDQLDFGGTIRRVDERASFLYVLHGSDQLSVLALDTRRPLFTTRGAVRFQYAMPYDIICDRNGEVRVLLPGTGAVVKELQLTEDGRRTIRPWFETWRRVDPALPYPYRSPGTRLTLRQGRLLVTLARRGTDSFALASFPLPYAQVNPRPPQ